MTTAAQDCAERVVKIGLATYRNEHNRTTYAQMHATVRIHPDDVEHFDRLNHPPKIGAILDPMPGIEDVRREPTAAERRIMEGFGERPITHEAQLIALAAAEQQDDFAAIEREREVRQRVDETLQQSSIEDEVQRRVEAELARRAQEAVEAPTATSARKPRG